MYEENSSEYFFYVPYVLISNAFIGQGSEAVAGNKRERDGVGLE